MSDRPDWLTYFTSIAEAVAQRGDCMRAQVGCVITDSNHFIIATGYNGFPSGSQGCRDELNCPRGVLTLALGANNSTAANMHCRATHAEVNALQTAVRTRLLTDGLIGGTMYITRLPCRSCVKEARRHGITTIYAEGWRINL